MIDKRKTRRELQNLVFSRHGNRSIDDRYVTFGESNNEIAIVDSVGHFFNLRFPNYQGVLI